MRFPRLTEETGLPVQWTQHHETPGNELDLRAGEARQEEAEARQPRGGCLRSQRSQASSPAGVCAPPCRQRVGIHDDPCVCPVAFPDAHPPCLCTLWPSAPAYVPYLPWTHPHTSAHRGPDRHNSVRTVTWASCAYTSCTLVCPHSSALHSGRPGFESRAESLLQESPVFIF